MPSAGTPGQDRGPGPGQTDTQDPIVASTPALGRGAGNSFSEMLAVAGLPVPVYAGKRERVAGRHDARLGAITHAIVGILAPLAVEMTAAERSSMLADLVRARVVGREFGRLDGPRIRVTGLVSQYLSVFSLAAQAEFVGTEVGVAGGRVDLVWRHPDAGFVVDEVKTSRLVPRRGFDAETEDQVTRYVAAGITKWGSEFVGVRLITLGNRESCLAFLPDGSVVPLDRSPLSLRALAGRAAVA